MANLFLDQILKDKITELLGETPSDLWLDIAWETLNSLVGYELDLSENIEELQGLNSDILYLVKRPVVSITELLIDNKVIDTDKYYIYKERAIKLNYALFKSDFPYPFLLMSDKYIHCDIKITYQGGFTAENFPNSLLLVATDLLGTLQENQGSAGNLKSYKISDISYTWKSQAEQNGRFDYILDNYRSV